MNKNRGVTSLEIVISLALIVLFLALIFPILRLTLKMERSFIIRERSEEQIRDKANAVIQDFNGFSFEKMKNMMR